MLEAALSVARASDGSRGAVPGALVPFLRFKRYPPRALEAALRALEDDDDFRMRVSEHVDRDAIGAVGALVLDQPEGWRAELAAMESTERELLDEQAAARDERRAARRVQTLEDRLAASEARERGQLELVATLREDLRLALVRQEELVEQLERTAGELSATRQRLDSTRQSRDDMAAAASRARARTAELERRLENSTPPAPREDRAPGEGDGSSGSVESFDDRRRAEGGAEVASLLHEAAQASQRLAAVLARAASLVGADDAVDIDDPMPSATTGAADGSASGATDGPANDVTDGAAVGAAPQGQPSRGGGPVRLPVRMPKGMVEDSATGLAHLLRKDGAVVIVDGYNVTLEAWPELPLGVQRRRLVDALRNLQARTGATPLVVFDGVEAGQGPSGSLPRSVQVRFSPPGVTADEVVVQGVGGVAEGRPVVVVSSDREVVARARSRGANTVSSATLVALMG